MDTDSLRVTWHGHSCFSVEHGGVHLLFDPYLTNNPVAKIRPETIRCTHVVCSHAHDDHSADALAIARTNRAPIFAPFELAEYFSAQGVEAVDLMPGGSVKTDFGEVKQVPAIHSASFEQPRGQNIAMGIAAGFLIKLGGKTVYFAGDTAVFSDMALIGHVGIDLAFLPIGDRYTMGIDDAVLALEYLCPAVTLPMHYNTHALIRVDVGAFAKKAAAAGHLVKILAVEETAVV